MIRVVDSNGNALAPTYQRRARGLVKAGRAEWTSLDMTEICLICAPPVNTSQENKMNINSTEIIDNEVAEKVEVTVQDYREITENPQTKPMLTVEYILEKMEQIRLDTAHIEEAFEMLRDFKINESPNGGFGDQARAEAIIAIVKCRETTNQKQLDILGKMYDFLTREGKSDR